MFPASLRAKFVQEGICREKIVYVTCADCYLRVLQVLNPASHIRRMCQSPIKYPLLIYCTWSGSRFGIHFGRFFSNLSFCALPEYMRGTLFDLIEAPYCGTVFK